MRSAADFDTPNSGGELTYRQVCSPVCNHKQDPVLQRQAPWPALANRVCALAS